MNLLQLIATHQQALTTRIFWKPRWIPTDVSILSSSWIHWAELNFPRDYLAILHLAIYTQLASCDLTKHFKTVCICVHMHVVMQCCGTEYYQQTNHRFIFVLPQYCYIPLVKSKYQFSLVRCTRYSVAICPIILFKRIMLVWWSLYYTKHSKFRMIIIISPPAKSRNLGSSAIKHWLCWQDKVLVKWWAWQLSFMD